MSDFHELENLLSEIVETLEKNVGGVTTTSSFAGQLSPASAAVMLTDGYKLRRKKKSLEKSAEADLVEEVLDIVLAEELEEDLSKCQVDKSSLIKGKEGVWRRVAGRPCYICKEGVIHAGPKSFIGKKAATLRDDLRKDRRNTKFKKRFSKKSE